MNQDRFSYDFFIGYASPDRGNAEKLFNLLKIDYRVFLDTRDILPGDTWMKTIEEKQKSSRVQVFLISDNTPKAHYQLEEIANAIQFMHEPDSKIRVVPIYLQDEIGSGGFPDAPYGLRILQGVNFDPNAGMQGVVDRLRPLIPPPGKQGMPSSSLGLLGPGIGWRDTVFNKQQPSSLPDAPVFAIELLTQPIVLEKRSNGRTLVAIDRTKVENAVYTTEGKNWLCREFLKDKVEQWAGKQDREIHDFLIRGAPERADFSLPLHNFPLRWASGGVLSVVKISGREGLWTPFFFRDIPPVGWNISLGASENNDELDNPWGFLLREFLEETLIHSPGPSGSTRTRMVKTFEVGPAPDGFRVERERAKEFSRRHRELRLETDAVDFQLQLHDDRYIIPCDLVKTMTDIRIRSRDGNDAARPAWKDVIVCFNLLELGIEVVKVLEYELAAGDQILDGEVLDRRDNKGEKWQELVRMPVALISHNYLKKAFGQRTGPLTPHYPELFQCIDGAVSANREQVKQPSVAPQLPLGPDDIIIFHRDALRRKEICDHILNGDELSVHPSDRKAFVRHMLWQKNFGHYFLDQNGKPVSNNPAPWFTFASAKTMSYYFADKK
ncbi:MAG: toll/interleukin-1 receptor domain-containing protein [Candidatus Aminicenantes bacterium]|nr:toll/interleukin-1 receptor domain-containing protein [Candidatus Aminicenantes bacterium]